ncbi:hypothetical protein JCM9140_3189 [Halalkalibacter wakoensis JCM 9140]|uniref:Uncharacterized protein n=1 Tax=Halalkalibacter wakoensis JCM 9140 TaxID=1236970 RepID=W4Q502_9BACI|nr:hypothetical protein JCM9140_3189 [Halalkalibacter wakoensis JCM 9140]
MREEDEPVGLCSFFIVLMSVRRGKQVRGNKKGRRYGVLWENNLANKWIPL